MQPLLVIQKSIINASFKQVIRFPTDIFFNEMSINLPSSCKLFIKHLQYCSSFFTYGTVQFRLSWQWNFHFSQSFFIFKHWTTKKGNFLSVSKIQRPLSLSSSYSIIIQANFWIELCIIYLPLFLHILHSDYVLYSL